MRILQLFTLLFTCVVGLASFAGPFNHDRLDALLFSHPNGQEDHLLIPQMDTHDLSDDDWAVLAEAIRQRQAEGPYLIKILAVGDTPGQAKRNTISLIEIMDRHSLQYHLEYIPTSMAREHQDNIAEIYNELAKAGFPGKKSMRWKHLFREADKTDWFIGALMGAAAAYLNADMWFFQKSLDPVTAFALVATTGGSTFFHSMKLKFFDRLYEFKVLGDKIGEKAGIKWEVMKRQGMNLFYAELYRFILFSSGPVEGAAHPLSWQGQAEIGASWLAYGLGSSLFSVSRNRVFKHNENVKRWVNLYNFPIIAWFLYQDIGANYNHSWDLGVIELHDTSASLLAANVVLASLLWAKPVQGFLEWIVEKQDNLYSKVKSKFVNALKTCSNLLTH